MNLNVTLIEPQRKDYERVIGFDWDTTMGRARFYGNGSPFSHNAEKMSKLIKDPVKLVRRAKAVAAVWGTGDYHGGIGGGNWKVENVWTPFERALRSMGFDYAQIVEIGRHTVDRDFIRSLR
jgi:catechol-2,3-dioxygenase